MDENRGRRSGVGVTEEGHRGGLAVEAGAGRDFAGLRRAVGKRQSERGANGGGITGRTAQRDREGVVVGEPEIAKSESGAVIAREEKIGRTVMIEVEKD